MNSLKHKITEHPHYGKALHWGKLLTVTGSAQIVVQAVGFVSGILVIRLLPVQEYAFYTLANTMLGTMAILSDGGISTGVMAQGGRVWQDKEKLGAVLATGLDLRRKFAIVSLCVSIPILLYLLIHQGASWTIALLIAASLIPAFFASLSDSLLQIPIKLHQAITPLQKNQVQVGIGRLLLTGLTVFAFPWAFIAIIASGIPRIWGNVRLRKIAERFADKEQQPDEEVKAGILKNVRKVLPGSIYYALHGQITIWLISIFGNTSSVAEVGALGRLMVGVNVFSVVIATLVVPRYSRLPEIRSLLFKRFFQVVLLVVVIGFLILGLIYIFSDQILYVLGSDYKNLNYELSLSSIACCLSLIIGTLFSLSNSRAYILSPWIIISVNILTQIVMIALLPLDSTQSVLFFSIISNIVVTIMLFSNFIYYLFKVKTEE